MLTEKRKVLDNMARVLIERETIYTDEVDMLLDGASVDEIYAFMDKNEKSEQENPFQRFVQQEEKKVPPEEAVPAVHGKPDDAKKPEEGSGSSPAEASGQKEGPADGAPSEQGASEKGSSKEDR